MDPLTASEWTPQCQGRGAKPDMGEAFPEILKRTAARQLYRLLRISAPLLRPFYRHVWLENRARAVTALVRIGWNGAEIVPPGRK